MATDEIEWGFQVPERERWRPGEGHKTDTREQAERFVAAHPGCTVVSRRVVITDWEPVG